MGAATRRQPATLGEFEGEIGELKACGHAIRALTDRQGVMGQDDKDAVFFLATLVIERCNTMDTRIDQETAHG